MFARTQDSSGGGGGGGGRRYKRGEQRGVREGDHTSRGRVDVVYMMKR